MKTVNLCTSQKTKELIYLLILTQSLYSVISKAVAKVKDSFVTLRKALHLMLHYPPFITLCRQTQQWSCAGMSPVSCTVLLMRVTQQRVFSPHKSNVDLIRVYTYLLLPVKVKRYQWCSTRESKAGTACPEKSKIDINYSVIHKLKAFQTVFSLISFHHPVDIDVYYVE